MTELSQLERELHDAIFGFAISWIKSNEAALGPQLAKERVATYLERLASLLRDPDLSPNRQDVHTDRENHA